MPGEELNPSPSPDPPREAEREGEAQPPPEDATPTKFTGEQKTSSKPDHQAEPDHLQNMGTVNQGFIEEPPPYTPPDPKDVHLYPPFQTDVPPRSYIFYQPTAPPQALSQPPNVLSSPYPFTIYQSAWPGESPPAGDQRLSPKDYMVESILVTVFCCLFTGLIALVYSHETRAARNRGDLIQATMASHKARSLVLFSLFFGLFVSISWIIYVVVTLYL
ncbi:proline rich transmembrane protein 1B isoform X2 [Ahaetulla prasina]|uniref:proline rich transmembrane protein 1B isoform X1 n=1 Tax=Ahaetulla prasina TaxID=499056 RepID=UPI002649CE95|nr:proline rich transmembrane protein 1B isoform X1 [Ahaetulla prasina]XP_058015349.1 proline rich transmembrane protein 1B isoform X2 [Ahaetulla prasina]